MDKVLFKEEWLSVKENNGYSYIHEERCNGILVSILPWRQYNKHEKMEFLMRMETCPAHGNNHEFCGIIGGYDDTSYTIEETAIKEVKEETGFDINLKRLNSLGWVWDSKVADTKVYLFTADLTGLEQGIATTDGTELEKNSYCVWAPIKECMNCKDSKVHTILNILHFNNIQLGGNINED